MECLEARSESNDEEKKIDVVGGSKAGMRSGAESEGLTFVDALRRTNLIATSDRENVPVRPGYQLVSNIFTKNSSYFYVNTHLALCVPCN